MATQGEIDWASTYDAYGRIAGTMASLHALLAPLHCESVATGAVPSWCGVDLLRAYAFALTRPDWPAEPLGLRWFALLDAISAHPEARLADLPPGRTD